MVAAVRPVGDCGIEAIEFCIRSPWLARPTPYDSRELIRFIEAIDKTGMNRIVRCFHPIKTCAPCANQSYPDEYQCVSFHIFSFIPTLGFRLEARFCADSLQPLVRFSYGICHTHIFTAPVVIMWSLTKVSLRPPWDATNDRMLVSYSRHWFHSGTNAFPVEKS